MDDSKGLEYSALVPMLPVSDVTTAVTFYERLGFVVGDMHTPDGETAPVWAWLVNGRAHLMINRADRQVEATHHSASLWLYTRNVEATHAALEARGIEVGEISYPPYNAGGEFHVHDPDGYAIFIAQGE